MIEMERSEVVQIAIAQDQRYKHWLINNVEIVSQAYADASIEKQWNSFHATLAKCMSDFKLALKFLKEFYQDQIKVTTDFEIIAREMSNTELLNCDHTYERILNTASFNVKGTSNEYLNNIMLRREIIKLELMYRSKNEYINLNEHFC